MKRLTLLVATAIICISATAQEKKDTIRIGGMIIVKDGQCKDGKSKWVHMSSNNSPRKNQTLSTNWWILDL